MPTLPDAPGAEGGCADPPRDPVGGLPLLTADLAGIGGRLKARLEDFAVEEIPQYLPCGEGEHVYLFIEKRDLSTSQAVHAIARHFNVPKRAIGYAGMKDKHAVTRQVISVHTPGKTFRDFPDLMNDRLVVLSAAMHTNKLRLGHLRGNRFSIKVRGTDMTGVVAARRVLARLGERGVPNYVGEQRFGVRLNNHLLGACYLRNDWEGVLAEMLGPDQMFPHLNREAREHYAAGRYTQALDAFPHACRPERAALHILEVGGAPKKAVQSVEIEQRRFWFSALQSAVFNLVLAARVGDGSWDRLLEGDVAMKRENGAMFAVSAAVLGEQGIEERVRTQAVSSSGPMWGTKMLRAAGAIDAAEIGALRRHGLEVADLAQAVTYLGDSMIGTRRPLRAPLENVEVEGGIDEHGHYVRCGFSLPAGSYATVVMREVMKGAIEATDGRDAE